MQHLVVTAAAPPGSMYMEKESIIHLPTGWVNSQTFETSFTDANSPHEVDSRRILFRVPKGCNIMVDAGVMLLSLANQLNLANKEVTLEFQEGAADGAMGYLNRMGFFDHLAKDIAVLPYRPVISGATRYRGTNANLVEFANITAGQKDRTLPTRLADTLEQAISHRPDHERKSLGHAAYTVFAELIDNIFEHSSTQLDGFAALQAYRRGGRGGRAKVVVSDSGEGIISTLRPALRAKFPRWAELSDTELVIEAFRHGISRHGPGRGCGLKRSADKAIKYRAELDVRLPNSRVHLTPSSDGYQPSTAFCYENLPVIWGTHICFDFRLD